MKNTTTIECGKHAFLLDHTGDEPTKVTVITVQSLVNGTTPAATPAPKPNPDATKPGGSRKRRAAEGDEKPPVVTVTKKSTEAPTEIDDALFAKFWTDGYYAFVLKLKPQTEYYNPNYSAEVTVRMPGPHGYISAVDYPLEIFYGMMGLVYIAYGVVWLVLLGWNWRDCFQVHFWIEGVIVLGMLEHLVFFAVYRSIALSGESDLIAVRGMVIVAELLSAMRRALARMLVIVVSLGIGILKPRLGQTFHKVLCVGVMYFVLGSIEGCMRALKSKSDQSNELMLAAVPLALLDSVICWWIFSSLVKTIRTLRLKENIDKLSLYRHFTKTLIFAVIASSVYMVWFITQHKLKDCITDWRGLWMDDAFWPLLSLVLLLIIMILWRPTAKREALLEEHMLLEDHAECRNVMERDRWKMVRQETLKMKGPKMKTTISLF